MSTSNWTQALPAVFAIASAVLVMRHLDKARRATPSKVGLVKYPVMMLAVGVINALLFYGLLVLSLLVPVEPASSKLLPSMVFSLFGTCGLMLMTMYYRTQHIVDELGMRYGRLFGPTVVLKWAEITSVTFSPTNKRFVLQTSNGRKARVSVMMQNLPLFARLVLEHVPAKAHEPRTQEMLVGASRGAPPQLF